jgi:rhomboid family protein
MLPLSDGMRARHFPIVNVSIIVANFCVWILYELPHLNHAVAESSFYACSVEGDCHFAYTTVSWGLSWITSMFMHGSWDHILGNMLFLAIFGKNVEDAFGKLQYLAFYFVGGLAATVLQTAMTLLFSNEAAEAVPNLGASGAIAAVLGAYFVLYPKSRVLTLVGIWPIMISAYVYLGLWFLYQLIEALANTAHANGGGVAFFAHVGGFIFGLVLANVFVRRRRWDPDRGGYEPDYLTARFAR